MKPTRLIYTLFLCVICSAVFAARPSDAPDVSAAPTPQGFFKLAALEIVGGDTPKEPAPADQPVTDAPQESSAPVTFATPLTTGGEGIEGQTLEQLIGGTPLFPPFDGLPEALWKGKACTTCHQWNRADLCEQGKRYLPEDAADFLDRKHPYGGGFKRNVKAWAENDCK